MIGGPPAGSAGGAPERRGLGGLLTTEVDRVPLGEHQGRLLHGHIERRVLRLASGGRVQLSLTLGRFRATAVEIEDATGTQMLAIPRVPDPWIATLRRTALLWAGSLLLTAAVGRVRSLLRGAAQDRAASAAPTIAAGSLSPGGVTSSGDPIP